MKDSTRNASGRSRILSVSPGLSVAESDLSTRTDDHFRSITPKQLKTTLQEQPWDVILCDFNTDPAEMVALVKEAAPDAKLLFAKADQLGELARQEWSNNGRHAPLSAIEPDNSTNALVTILDTMQDAVLSLSLPDRKLLYVSASFEKVLGYPAEFFLNDPNYFRQVVHPDDLPKALAAMQTAYRDGCVELDHRIILPDGTVRWLNRRAWINFDEHGEPIQLNDTARDITIRRHAEAAGELHTEILRNMTEGIHLVRVSDQTFVYTNPAFERLFGYAPGELIGKHVSILNDPSIEHPEEIAKQIVQTLLDTGHWSGEIRNIRKDGTDFWSSANVIRFDHADYGPVWITVQQDITDLKREQRVLREQAILLEQVSDAVITLDFSTAITSWNKAAADMYGWTIEEALGQPSQAFLKAEFLDSTFEEAFHSLTTTGHWKGHLREETKDGRKIVVLSSTNLVYRDGEPVGFITINRDVTERHKQDTLQHRITQVLEAIVDGKPLKQVLEQLVIAVEEHQPDIKASVLLIDKNTQTLQEGAAPSLPDAYNTAVYGIKIGYGQGSCGTAAFTKQLTIVEDIQADPLWAQYRDLAGQYGLRACWSQPILDQDDTVLGTFALYYNHPRSPSAEELELIQMVGHIAGIAIRRTLAEAALRASEERYRHIVQDQSELVCRYDTDLCVTFGNRAYCEAFELPEDEIIGQSILRRIPETEHAAAWAHIRSLTPENPTAISIHHALRDDGSLRWTEWKDRAIFDAEGQIIEYQGVGRDITEQRLAEEALRKSEDLFQRFMNHLPAIAYVFDEQSSLTYCNSGFVEFIGQPLEAIRGKTLIELFGKELGQTIADENKMVLSRNEALHIEFVSHRSQRAWQIIKFPLPQPDGKAHVACIGINVTEQKQVQEELRRSEELFQLFMTHLPAVVYINDDQGRLTYCNAQYAEQFDLTPEEIIGKTVGEYAGEEIAQMAAAENVQVIAQNSALEFDAYIPSTQHYWRTIKFPLPQPKTIPYIGYIAINTTEQKLAEQARRNSEERYRSIIEDQSEYVCRYDANLNLTFANSAYCRAYGHSPESVVGKSILETMPPEEHASMWAYLREMTPENPTAFSVARSFQIDSKPHWVEWKDRAILDAEGRIVEYQGVGRDITQQKEAEEALRASEEKYRSLIESSDSAIAMFGKDNEVLFVNTIAAASLGLTPEEVMGKNMVEVFPDKIATRQIDGIQEVIKSGKGHVRENPSVVNGEERWYRTAVQPVRNASGEVTAAIINAIDITERKRSEDALRKSEEHFRFLFINHPHPMWVYDRETLAFLEVNDAAVEHYGYSHDEFSTMRLPDIRPVEDVARLMDDVQAERPALQHSGEWRHQLKDGRVIPVEITSHTLDFAGRPAALVVAQDISERKEAQDALQAVHSFLEQRVAERTEELEKAINRLEAIFNHSADGILLLDIREGIQQANYAFDEMFGVAADSYFAANLGTFFHPEDARIIDLMVHQVAQTHQSRRVEVRTKRGQNQFTNLEISLAPVNRSSTPVTNLVCIIRDITERKRVQAALQQYAAEIRDLYDFAPTGYHSLDQNGHITRINQTELQWLGYTEHELVGKLTIRDLLTPESQTVFARTFPVFKTQGFVNDLDLEFVRKDGTTFWALVNATAIYDGTGQYLYSRSTMIDITDLKRVQQAVAEERNLLRTVIDAVPDFIYVKDAQHRMVLNNVSHARSLGFQDPAEAVGKTDFELFPLEFAAKFHSDESRIFATGEAIYGVEERSHGQDGEDIWALTTKVPLRNLKGDVIGLVGTTHDITHLKASEEALRRSQADLQSVIDSTSTMFVLVDLEGNVRLVNRLAREAIFRLSGHYLEVGEPALKAIPQELNELFAVRLAQVVQEGKSIVSEYHTTLDGEGVDLEFRYYPVTATEGGIVGVTIAATDITERKAAETQLRYLASLQEQMQEAVIAADLTYHIQSWNQAAERLYGWKAEEVLGLETYHVLGTETLVEASVSSMRQMLQDTGSWQGELIHHHKDGTPIYVLASVVLSRDEGGTPIGVIAVTHDITERKLAEQELERRYQQDREMQSYLTALHEISIELMRTETMDDFNRLVVKEGLARFGFERIGLLMYNHQNDLVSGTYGTDQQGNLVPEYHLHLKKQDLSGILQRSLDEHDRFRFEDSAPLFANFKPIGTGQNAVAVLWHGEVLGWLAIDNGVTFSPIRQTQLDILALYAMTVASLLARKRAEDALRESEERYRFLAENIQDVIIKSDADGIHTYVSPSVRELSGHEPEDLIGISTINLIHPDDVPHVLEHAAQVAMGGGNSYSVVHRLSHKDGHYYWGESTSTILRDARTGEITGYISLVRDVTERKAAEDALRASEERYRFLAENIQDVIIKTTPDGRQTYVSPSCRDLIEYTPEELINRSVFEFIHPDDLIALRERVAHAVTKGDNFLTFVHRLLHKAGHYLWVEATMTIVPDPSTNQPSEFISLVKDITERKAAEDALRASEERYRFLAENIQDVIVRFDPDLKRTYATPSTYQLLGYSPDEFMAMPVLSLTHPDDRESFRSTLQNAVASKSGFFMSTSRIQHQDGHYIWVEIGTTIVRNAESGEVIEFITLTHDITERKAAEDALRESEERYRLLAERVTDVILRYSISDHKRTFVTPSCYQLFGYTVDELLQEPQFDITHPDDRAAVLNEVQKALKSGVSSFSFQQRTCKKDGTYIWVEVMETIVRDPATQAPIEMIAVIRDITERKNSENALRESEMRFRLFVESAPLATIVSDHTGMIVLVNDAGERLLGYDKQELIGQPIEVLIPPAKREDHLAYRTKYMEHPTTRAINVVDLQALHKDGALVPVEIQLSSIQTKPNPMVMSLILDVTERKAAEEALRQALAHEKELGDLKSRFVSMASHEFRTPLAAIMATTETLTMYRDKMSSDQINNRLDKIRLQVNHMKGIMEEVLELARIQAGRVEFRPTLGNFDEFCQEIVDEYDSQAAYRGRIIYESDHTSEDMAFDQRLAHQIVSNLISNALKYSTENKPIFVRLVESPTEIILKVRDQGIGIPPDDMKHLFEPFHRASNIGTISGTGLGLSITKQAVDLHSGTIIPESVLGIGTTFTVTLPKIQSRATEK